MIVKVKYNPRSFQDCAEELLDLWSCKSNKVFVIEAEHPPINVKNFYFENFKYFGNPFPLGEDASADRNKKSDGSIWFEVRNDVSIPNAYRHSTEAQPLHTDGSYIPNFPSSTIMACVNNAVRGGETTFIDSIKLFEILDFEDPNLLDQLLNETFTHQRSSLTKKEKVIRQSDNDVYLNWNYFCLAKILNEKKKIIAKNFYKFLKENKKIRSATHFVKLKPGDSVFWRDELCLHGRNSFVAKNSSDRFLWKCAIDIGK